MVGSILFFVVKAAAWGIISYGAPRLLVALGVPLDRWIVALGAALAIRVNRQVALWSATVLVGVALYVGSFWLPVWMFPHAPAVPSTIVTKPPSLQTPSAPPSPNSGARQYTDKTARELVTLFVGRTPLQANSLLGEDIEKWLKVSGKFNNAYESNSEGDSAVLIQDGSAMIQCAFGPQWTAQINRLNRGDPISAEGQIINSQMGNPFWLVKCELD